MAHGPAGHLLLPLHPVPTSTAITLYGPDTFTATDGTLPSSPWAVQGDSGTVWSVLSNQMASQTAAWGYRNLYYNAAIAADQWVEFDIVTIDGGMNIGLRYTNNGPDPGIDGAYNLQINSDGSWQAACSSGWLGSGGAGTFGLPGTVRFEVEGENVRVYRNRSLFFSSTASPTGRSTGSIVISSQPNNVDSTVIDNLSVGIFVVVPSAPTITFVNGGDQRIGAQWTRGAGGTATDWEIDTAVQQTTYTDNFNRADGVLGANWLDAGGTSGRDILIASNKASAEDNGAGNVNRSVWATAAASNEQWAECDVFAGGEAQIGAPVICGDPRTAGTQDTNYTIRWTTGTGAFQLHRAGTSVASTTVTVTGTDRVRLQSELVGASFTIKAYVNSVLVLTYVDPTPLIGLYFGLTVRGAGTADNWSGGQYAPYSWYGAQSTGSTNPYGAATGNFVWNGITYVVRVRGVNAAGTGAWSATSGSATPTDTRGAILTQAGDNLLTQSADLLTRQGGMITTGGNMLFNSSFEWATSANGTPDAWTVASTGSPTATSTSIITTTPSHGTRLVQLQATLSVGDSYELVQSIGSTSTQTVTPGIRYTFSVQMRGSDTDNTEVVISILWYSSAGSLLATTSSTTATLTGTLALGWVTGLAPATAFYCVVSLKLNGAAGASAETITGIFDSAEFEGRASPPGVYTEWTPFALGTKLVTWFDPSDAANITLNGSNVAAIADDSIYSNGATQATAGSQPLVVTNVLNGRSIMRFDGTTDYLSIPDANSLDCNSSTILVVFASTSAAADRVLVEKWDTSFTDGHYNLSLRKDVGTIVARQYDGSNVPTATSTGLALNDGLAHIARADVVTASTVAVTPDVGTTVSVSNTASGTRINTARVGVGARGAVSGSGGGDLFFAGDMGEVIITSAKLTTEEKNEAVRYLATRWGVVITTASAAPLVIGQEAALQRAYQW